MKTKRIKPVSIGLTILSLTLNSCGADTHGNFSTTSDYKTSSGYSDNPAYKPTVSNDGDFHTIDGKRRQIQYQGSAEQKRDLDMIDEYMKNNPDF